MEATSTDVEPAAERNRSPRACSPSPTGTGGGCSPPSPSPLRRRLQRAVADHAGQCPLHGVGAQRRRGQGVRLPRGAAQLVRAGLPYVIGLSFRWFAADNYVPLTLFVLACGMLSLVLAYHLPPPRRPAYGGAADRAAGGDGDVLPVLLSDRHRRPVPGGADAFCLGMRRSSAGALAGNGGRGHSSPPGRS